MADLEDVLRDTLRAHAADTPDMGGLVAASRTRHSRHRARRNAVAALAVAAATIAVIVIPLSLSGSSTTPTPPAIFPRPSASSSGQVIGFHGIDVTVPTTWKINDTRCGTPVANTVIRDEGATEACALARRPNVSSIEFLDNPQNWTHVLRGVRTMTNSLGVRLERGTISQRPGITVIVPAVNVLMFLDTVHPADAGKILDSIRVTATDVTGCAMHPQTITAPTGYHPANPSSLAAHVIPPDPASIAVCDYADYWLAGAATLIGTDKTRLVHQADTVPTGFAHAPTNSYLRSSCPDATKAGGEAGTGFILVAHYTDRAPITLWVHVGFCGPLGITNGVRSGQLTAKLAEALAAPLHSGFGMPGKLLPGPGG